MSERPTIDELLDKLKGPREVFRDILTDKDAILARMCRYAQWKAKEEGVPPWSIIGEITSHGSGVSSCIYELYRPRTDDEVPE